MKVEVKYTTTSGEYSYIDSFNISTALPLSVGVTDSFSPKRLNFWKSMLTSSLLSIFAVHCTASPLRILNVQLQSRSAFNVWTGSPQERNLVCIPNTAAKFIY